MRELVIAFGLFLFIEGISSVGEGHTDPGREEKQDGYLPLRVENHHVAERVTQKFKITGT